MDRRRFIQSLGTTGGVGVLAGCTGVLGGSTNNVTLAEPDREFESSDVPYPAWDQRVPDVTLSAPLDEREISIRGVETPSVVTFFYSHCKTICPVLISALRNVQTDAIENGYENDVAFLPITFDPPRDTATRLETYAEKMNVDRSVGDWHFLRPQTKQAANSVVTEEFGVRYERSGSMDGMYMFNHSSLVLLVNADGYVERAYRGNSPDASQIVDDLEQVRG